MKNKEVMDRLQKYFMSQKPESVARICASMMIDLNRFYVKDFLSDDEYGHLLERTRHLTQELKKFIDGKETDEELTFSVTRTSDYEG